MITGKRIACIALTALVASACSDQTPSSVTDVDVDLLQASADLGNSEVSELQDGSSGGNPNFLWLAPISGSTPPGPLATGAAPEVEICNKYDECTRNPAEETGDHYHLGLKSGIDEKPKDGSPYRIRTFDANGYLLGSFVVSLDSNRNIPLKFWVGEGFLAPDAQECVDDDRCDLGTVVSDLGGTVRVTASGEGVTEVIAAAIFPDDWSPGGIDRTVVIDCRNNLPPEVAPGGSGPLNTGLTQLPWYCDFSVDPALDPGQTFNEPVVVEVCETVDLDHASVVLGKSSGPSDFELLPFVTPVALGNCFIDYPTVPQGQASLWSQVTRRLAGVFKRVGPQPLRANMRDGGAGGSVDGFSRINPVIPATISGTLTDSGGGGLDNVTVSLSNGDAVVTAQGGQYSFALILDASYTVTVDTSDPDFPSSETLVANSAAVQVTGSGDFVADFQTSPINYVWAGTYNTATKFGGVNGIWSPNTPVVITANRQVTRGGVAIINPTVTATGVSWAIADGNATNASFTFLTSSSNTYYWSAPVSGMLFQGSIQFAGSGPLDYRGLVPPPLPTINSATPAFGGSSAFASQMVTFFVQNVATPNGNNPDVDVTFDIGGQLYSAFVFGAPSSGSQLYVRMPAGVTGAAQVTITDNNTGLTGPSFPFVVSNAWSTPVVVSVAPQTVVSGSLAEVQTYGGNGGEACFTQGAAPTSGPTCAGTTVARSGGTAFNNYEAGRYTVPNLSSGPVWIQVRAGISIPNFFTVWSDWSAPFQVTAQ